MFTGIIEARGKVIDIQSRKSNRLLYIESTLAPELSVDQSISHNGVCLTVVDIQDNIYEVVIVKESLDKTTLGDLQVDDHVNLEKCVSASSLMDGHIVQGHVDETLTCTEVMDRLGSWHFKFSLPPASADLIVARGSICINGVSLTVSSVHSDWFEVAIIPYTFKHAGFDALQQNDRVNVEYDIIGKYIQRYLDVQATKSHR